MQAAPSDDVRRPRRPLVRLAALVLVLCVTALLFEGGHRAWLALRGKSYDSEATRTALSRLLDAARSFVPRVDQAIQADVPATPEAARSIHPFVAWEYSTGVQMIDDELESARTRGAYDPLDVLILGGSVSEMFGHLGTEPLAKALAADPRVGKRGVHYLKFGRGGFKEPQQLNFLAYLLSIGFEPEAVLVIDGFNEVALGSNNAALGVSPVFPSFPHWTFLALGGTTDPALLDIMTDMRGTQRALEATCERALRLHFEKSSLFGTIAVGRATALRRSYNEATERYTAALVARSTQPALRGPRRGASLEENLAQSVRCWQESSRMTAAICAARSIAYLHVLQPTLHDPQGKTPTEDEKRDGAMPAEWMDGVRTGYPMLRAAGAELVGEGVPFLDLSPVFNERPETIYSDSCHFWRLGNRLLAEAIAPALLEQLPEQD